MDGERVAEGIEIASNELDHQLGTGNEVKVEVSPPETAILPLVKQENGNEVDQQHETGPIQTHTIVVPSYSSWIDLEKVNTIERESLPDFFDGKNKSKTSGIYKQYRNFMINSYRLNPNEYLSFTAARRNLMGDAGSILRIFKFLNKWGLINYQVDPESKPQGVVQPPASNDYAVDLDTPRGMFPFESFKPSLDFPNVSKFKHALDISDDQSQQQPKKIQKIITPDINNGWSTEDLTKLIQGVKEFKSDWFNISKIVGNGKSPEECIMRFLQLPMEDKFLEENKEMLGPLKFLPNLSFSLNDNPIMSTLAFLVKLVDPKVAAAASQRAITAIEEDIEEKLKERDDPLEDVKEATNTMMGIIGSRAHIFSNYESREMYKSLTNILQLQMKVVDLKLKKLDKLETQFQYKEKEFNKRADDLLQEKISMFKYTNAISNKLLNAISILETSQNAEDLEKSKNLISQAKDIIYKPPKNQMNILGQGESEDDDNNKRTDINEGMKPISLESPMLYRYWSG